MIKSGGYNLYPREIETVVEAHPSVAMGAVVGLPDVTYREAAHAILALRARSAVTSAEFRAWCARELANYKPRSFRLIAEFPCLANGKVDRAALNALASSLPHLS